MLTHALELFKGSWRYARGLRGFLSITLELEEAERMVRRQLQVRNETFLRVLERGIYDNPRNPYRRLLLHAGFELEDVRTLVNEQGLEGALSRLYEDGVYVTLDEFKGRAPIRRPGLEFSVSDRDFDNPLLTEHYEGSTGGSRGGGTRVPIDFDFFAYEAAGWLCDLQANGDRDRPQIIWFGAPPAPMGVRGVLLLARLGIRPRWFSPSKPLWNRQGLQARALIAFTLVASRIFGRPLPRPEYLLAPSQMVAHLSEAVRRGKPAVVHGVTSQAVRICLAAEEAGADIRGTGFRVGGEPYTEGKAAVIERLGAVCMPGYGMYEAGTIGLGCSARSIPDDMHVLKDRLAIIQRPLQLGEGQDVQALIYTSLLPSSPKLMLNVESGDYGVIEERDCGCLWQQLGMTTHISHVRSYEKLTSEGVMFMGSMLYHLLEETLPARFGGSVTDYQLAEEEEDGLPRVSIVVSPRIGPVDETAVFEAVIESVGFADWSRRMADTWREAGTLRVMRREPYTTGSGKILPLHVLSGVVARANPGRAATEDGTTVQG